MCSSFCTEEQCSYPGPTLRLLPGDELQLTIVNELGNQPDVDEMEAMNTMHSPNTTNVHTHGLHIDPGIDNVFIRIHPGETYTYLYNIPQNHAPGLHWYHAHVHGSVSFQVMAGLLGAIIIEPNLESNVPDSISSCASHILVITEVLFNQAVSSSGIIDQGCGESFACDPIVQYPLCTGSEDVSPYNSLRHYSFLELAREVGSELDIDPEFADGNSQDVIFINGQIMPVLDVQLGIPSIVRVVTAIGSGEFKLHVDNSTACRLTVLAVDGVYLRERWEREYVLVMEGSRADIEITCISEGIFVLQHRSHDILHINSSRSDGSASVSSCGVTDIELQQIQRPSYLEDLMGSEIKIDDHYAVSLSRTGFNESICGEWMGAGRNCSMIVPWGPIIPDGDYADCPFSQFEGERGIDRVVYEDSNKLVTKLGSVNEWRFYGELVADTIYLSDILIFSLSRNESSSSNAYSCESLSNSIFYRSRIWNQHGGLFPARPVARYRPCIRRRAGRSV